MAAGFADLFEVRSHERERRGRLQEIISSETDVAFVYMGLDGTERKTNIYFEPPPTQPLASAATYQLRLEVGKVLCIFMSVECLGSRLPERTNFLKGLVAANRDRRLVSRYAGSIETSNNVLNEALCRAMADLRMLITGTPEGSYPSGGIISLCRHPLVFHHLRS